VLTAALPYPNVLYESLDLFLRHPNVQERVRILLVLRAMSDRTEDIGITHFPESEPALLPDRVGVNATPPLLHHGSTLCYGRALAVVGVGFALG